MYILLFRYSLFDTSKYYDTVNLISKFSETAKVIEGTGWY